MSDAELRECERALAEAPDNLQLLRQHARLLRRHGHLEQALSTVDLAWRLGADDLMTELSSKLDERSFEFLTLRFRYVPAGPFVMGLDDFDADAQPAHLVHLSGYYISDTPVTYRSMLDSPDLVHAYWRDLLRQNPDNEFGERALVVSEWGRVETALAHAEEHRAKAQLPPGRLTLPTEAQWERAFRAGLLRSDGVSIYGVKRATTLEWVSDSYRSNTYDRGPVFDPLGPNDPDPRVVRGVAALPDALFPIYRESSDNAAAFRVGRLGRRRVQHEAGICFRLVLQPT